MTTENEGTIKHNGDAGSVETNFGSGITSPTSTNLKCVYTVCTLSDGRFLVSSCLA
jgi:hypothetical protein